MTLSSDRRRHRRYPMPDLPGTLYVSSDAKVLNMSLTGLAVESSTCLRPGVRYAIGVGDKSARLKLPAHVQWCHLDGVRSESGESVPVYRAGLSFRDMLSDKAHDVLGLLKEHVTVELERRVFGRIRLREAARLSESYDLVVKTLSLSGVLALTDIELEPDTVLDLELGLPDGDFRVAARVAYARALGTPEEAQPCEVGMELLDLRRADRDRIERLLVDQIE